MGIIYSKGSGVADSVFGKSQAPIRAMIEENVESFQKSSMIDKIFYMDKTKNYAEKYTTETALGDFENVGENGAYPKSSIQEGYSKVIEPLTWKSSFEVTMEMLEDAKIGKIKSRANVFSTSYNRTREKFAANLLAGGVGKSIVIGNKTYDTTGADKAALFDKAHPSITKETDVQSNMFKVAFSQNALDTVQEKMQQFTDDNGNLLNVAPDTIIIPNVGSLKRAVFAAIGSELDPNTPNNAFNFQMGLWNVIVWNYLPTTIGGEAYFLMMDSQYNKDYMCLPWLDRVNLSVTSDIDPNTDANIWKGRARFGAGFNNWRSVAICGGGLTNGTVLSW